MHADHVVADVDAFRRAVVRGARKSGCGWARSSPSASSPRVAETGYGYIRADRQTDSPDRGRTPHRRVRRKAGRGDGAELRGQRRVPSVEQRDIRDASGTCGCRSWAAFARTSSEACRAAAANGTVDGAFFRPGAAVLGVPDGVDRLRRDGERPARRTSPASRGCTGYSVVPLEGGWSDVGAWSAVWDEGERDADGNIVQGDVYAESTRDSLLIGSAQAVGGRGPRGHGRGRDGRRCAGCPQGPRPGRQGDGADRLRADGRVEHDSHRKAHRPWGSYEVLDEGPGFQVKRLVVDPRRRAVAAEARAIGRNTGLSSGATARVTVGRQAVRTAARTSRRTCLPARRTDYRTLASRRWRSSRCRPVTTWERTT